MRRSEPVEEATLNILVAPATPWTSSLELGLSNPTPTFPPFATIKLVAVDEPTTNCGAPLDSPFAFTERSPQGVEEPTPKFPLESIFAHSELELPFVNLKPPPTSPLI